MPKVLFTVSYTIQDGKRTEYLALVTKLRTFYTANGVGYAVYEDNSKHNHFQEVYVYSSMEAYEASDDPETTKEVADILDAVYSLATGVTYNVAREVI